MSVTMEPLFNAMVIDPARQSGAPQEAAMLTNTIIEVVAVAAGLLYIVLLIREKVACWPFGIAGSLLSIYLFVETRLYSEAILYTWYVGMGIWGWVRWSARESASNNPVVGLSLAGNAVMIAICVCSGVLLGGVLSNHTDAQRPMIDALTTTFSFAATFLQVRKILHAWLYWTLINLVTVWLYQDRTLDIYAGLMVLYTVLSVVGFLRWLGVYRGQAPANPQRGLPGSGQSR